MRAREPNSWLIRCHRTWTRELAVSCPSTILHVWGGRSSPRNFWCFWYDELLEQPSEHLWQTVPHRSRHSCCACKSGLCWKGFFSVCSLLTAGRRNRMTKSLQMRDCLKLNKKYWRTQASMSLCELWNFNFNGNGLQISQHKSCNTDSTMLFGWFFVAYCC